MLTAVIDTNIWLDLLVFDDAGARRLRGLLDDRGIQPLATEAMRAELADVLGRPQFALSPPRQSAMLERFDALVSVATEAPDCRLACRDPDDRKFLDLAVGRGTRWLLSRDRALLAARKPAARRFGLHIGALPELYRWLDESPL